MQRLYTLDIGWFKLARLFKLDIATILTRSGIDKSLSPTKPHKLTVEQYYQLWENTIPHDNPEFIVDYIQTITPDTLNATEFAALSSENFSIALARIQKYRTLIGPIMIDVRYDELHNTSISLSGFPQDKPFPLSLSLIGILMALHLVRLGTGKHIKPLKVELAHAAISYNNSQKFVDFLGVPLSFSSTNNICFSSQVMTMPFNTIQRPAWFTLEPRLKQCIQQLHAHDSFREKVEQYLFKTLASGAFSVERAAEDLTLSKRTLQRKLADEGTSFKHILSEVRQEFAKYYLTKTNFSFTDIAFLLGFDDPNSFFRACQYWFEQTPKSYRNSME